MSSSPKRNESCSDVMNGNGYLLGGLGWGQFFEERHIAHNIVYIKLHHLGRMWTIPSFVLTFVGEVFFFSVNCVVEETVRPWAPAGNDYLHCNSAVDIFITPWSASPQSLWFLCSFVSVSGVLQVTSQTPGIVSGNHVIMISNHPSVHQVCSLSMSVWYNTLHQLNEWVALIVLLW